MKQKLLGLLTFCDSALPAGGFAHSNGFEAARQFGLIYNKESFLSFCRSSSQNAASQNFPVIYQVYCKILSSAIQASGGDAKNIGEADCCLLDENVFSKTVSKNFDFSTEVAASTLDLVLDLNETVDASLSGNYSEHKSSSSQGIAWLSVAAACLVDESCAEIKSVKSLAGIALIVIKEWFNWKEAAVSPAAAYKAIGDRDGNEKKFNFSDKVQHGLRLRLCHDTDPHLSVVAAITFASFEASLNEAFTAYIYIFLRSTISAAVRDGLIGSVQGQQFMCQLLTPWPRLYNKTHDLIEDLISKYGIDRNIELSVPLLDVLQSGHHLLFARLFLS